MKIVVVALVFCLSARMAVAEQTQATPRPPTGEASLTLRDAVTRAVETYPAVKAALANAQASAAGVDLARTSYYPRADVLWQLNRATRNSVTGLLLPQPVVAGISGGIGVDRNETAWGSATGVLFNWEPFDLGVRGANVASAQSTLDRSTASVTLTRLQIATAAAEAFLNVVGTQQTLRTAAAAVERARVLHQVVGARVQAGLRPAVDAERARAELAVAETQLILAEQNASVARVVLAQYTGLSPEAISVNAGLLLELPADDVMTAIAPQAPPTREGIGTHPLAAEQNAAIEESRARLRVAERTYFPRFNLLFNTYARGSGVLPNGTVRSGFGGILPDVSNWAVGLNVLFPVMDRPAVAARTRAERQRQLTESARYDRVVEELESQLARSRVLLDGARRVSANTPFQLAAARATHQQATARYQSGLSGIVELADAERLLTQAEIDDSLAKLNVWRGLLLAATARGDLDPFLARAQP